MITFENKKILDLLTQKDNLVIEGRSISSNIENIEKKIIVLKNKEKAITGKVKCEDLVKYGDELNKQANELVEKIAKVAEEINNKKLAAIPEDIKKEHLDLLKQSEELVKERNKIALKIQKIKDRVVPLIKKVVTPLLVKKYDDIETATVKDGKIIINTFNHLEQWEKNFKKSQ